MSSGTGRFVHQGLREHCVLPGYQKRPALVTEAMRVPAPLTYLTSPQLFLLLFMALQGPTSPHSYDRIFPVSHLLPEVSGTKPTFLTLLPHGSIYFQSPSSSGSVTPVYWLSRHTASLQLYPGPEIHSPDLHPSGPRQAKTQFFYEVFPNQAKSQ